MTDTVAQVRLDPPDPLADVELPRAPRRNWLLGLAVVCSTVVTLVWVSAGVRASGRGLNVADESYYLLSYRWWDVNYRNFTGAQYLYGPVFEMIGYNIAGLRLFRLATILAVHVVFGWSFMRWLRLHRPTAPPTRLWEAAGTAAVVAAGGVACGWLPLSPGYNDAALLGALLAMSFVLFAAGHVGRGRRIPLRLPIGYGVIIPLLLLTKWSSLATILLTAAAAAMVLGRMSMREIARILGGVAAGTTVVVALLHLLVPMTTAIAELVEVNRLMSGNTSPINLLRRYSEEIYRLLYGAVNYHWLLLVAAAVAVAVSWLPAIRMAAGVLAVVAIGLSIEQVVIRDGVHGGAGYASAYTRTLLVALLVVVWIAVLVADGERVRRARWLAGRSLADEPPATSSLATTGLRGWLLLAALVLLPMAQAVGTTGGLSIRAIGGFAAWMAVMIAVFTGMEAAASLTRAMVATVLAATLLATGFIAVGGLWRYPYRTYPLQSATETATGMPALESIRFHPATAQALTELRRQLGRSAEPEGRAMIGVPALVLALGGRPVGEPWVGVPGRVEAGIRDDCRGGAPWWASRPPVLLYAQPVSPGEIDAFASCGIDFDADYRLLATYRIPTDPKRTIDVQVFVPTREFATVPGYPLGSAPRALAGRPR